MYTKVILFICVVLAVCASVAVAVDYIVVDDFDSYADPTELRLVWKDSISGGVGGNAEVFVNKDANFAVDGNSMRFDYWNTSSPYYSETKRTYSTGQDWSYAGAGVTALELDFFGDANSTPDPPMYVKLSDDTNTAQVNHTDNNDVTEEWQHTWVIPLQDFSNVNLSNITSIILGIGDKKGEGGKPYEYGTIYFDDIRLYPPRCYPEHGPAADFTDDCTVDVNDLRILVRDWCMSGGWYLATMPVATPVVEYLFEEGSGTDVVNTGSYGSSYDLVIGRGVDASHNWITDPNNDPCWFNDSDPCRGWTLWFDGNVGHPQTNYVGDTGDYLIGPALNLNSNTVTITAWLKPDPWHSGGEYYWQKGSYTGLVHSRDASTACGMTFGFCGCFGCHNDLQYLWDGKNWQFDSFIWVPDWQWSMAAVVIEPEQATLYLADTNGTADPNDDVMLSGTHVYNHQAEEFDGLFVIAGDGGIVNGGWADRFFRGQLDAVRVYDVSLTPGEILGLAGMEWEGMVYLPLRSDADLCVGRKDPCDPCGIINDQIDFCDWSKFADEWLETKLWPQP